MTDPVGSRHATELDRDRCRYSGKTSWSASHERYLASFSFAHPA
ncbi:MAG: hypothetical protein WCB10_07080 [Steroidobacteraceae bacterium]